MSGGAVYLRLGLLKEDKDLHDFLDERLRAFEEKYGVIPKRAILKKEKM